MLGFGFSAKPLRHAYSILAQATLHEQILQMLGVKRTHLLGHDSGSPTGSSATWPSDARTGIAGWARW